MIKKVIFLSEKGGFCGGVEKFIFQAAQALRGKGVYCIGFFRESGENLTLFSTAFNEISFDLSLVSRYAKEADLLWIHKMKDLYKYAYLQEIIKVAIYVHDHDYCCYRRHKYFPFTRKNCILKSQGHYCYLCGCLSRSRLKWSHFKANLNFLCKVDTVLVGSEFMKQTCLNNGVKEQKITILSPLIHLGRPLDLKEKSLKEKDILFVGQVIKGKGVDLLIRAFAKMKERSRCQLTIVGTGDDLEGCQMLAIEKHISIDVHFMDYEENLESFYRTANVFAFPSRWQEPFGMSGPEAMSRGIPVVAFDVGGVSEWLKHESNGLLVPSLDVDAFAEALDRLVGDETYAEKLGSQAALDMLGYSQESFAEKSLSVFDGVQR